LQSDKNISLVRNKRKVKTMLKKSIVFSSVIITVITLVPFLITSCGSKHEEGSSQVNDFEVTKDTIKSEVRINFDMLRVNIPTPKTLSTKLSASKITFNKNFLTPPSKASSFSTVYQKAAGLGAMGADLSVAAGYNQSQEVVEYLGQIGKLANDLGIGSAFDQEFSKILLQNVNKPDTFQVMLDKAFDKAERNLRSNQRVAISIIMITGGWIEGLAVSVEGLNTNPNGPNVKTLYSDINAHCHSFDYIFELLDAYKTNADCAKLIQDLEPFKPTLISIGRNSKLGPNDLPKVRETVSQLRSKIIG
jgi:hypothetical protein